MTSMRLAAKTLPARLWRHGSDGGESNLAIAHGRLVGKDQSSNNDAFLGSVEQRFLRRVEGISEPSRAEVFHVCDTLDQDVVNRVRLAQRSETGDVSNHDFSPRKSRKCWSAHGQIGGYCGALASLLLTNVMLTFRHGYRPVDAFNARGKTAQPARDLPSNDMRRRAG